MKKSRIVKFTWKQLLKFVLQTNAKVFNLILVNLKSKMNILYTSS